MWVIPVRHATHMDHQVHPAHRAVPVRGVGHMPHHVLEHAGENSHNQGQLDGVEPAHDEIQECPGDELPHLWGPGVGPLFYVIAFLYCSANCTITKYNTSLLLSLR